MERDDELKAGWAAANPETATVPQPMPVVRPIYWPALIPQALAIGTFAWVLGVCLPAMTFPLSLFFAALVYLLLCRTLRTTLARDHVQGMKAFRAGRFAEAIRHFEASRTFWCSRRSLDAWRSVVFGVANYNPYRVMALLNAAFCHAQLGDAGKAIQLYDDVLVESPRNTLATLSLRMLRAGRPDTSREDTSGAGVREEP